MCNRPEFVQLFGGKDKESVAVDEERVDLPCRNAHIRSVDVQPRNKGDGLI